MHDDGDAREADPDTQLWIRTTGCASVDFLTGNPHTFPGRMEAFCPHRGRSFAVSKHEVLEASREARYWMAGYLCGNEPAPPERKDWVAHWRTSIQAFHEHGVWPLD